MLERIPATLEGSGFVASAQLLALIDMGDAFRSRSRAKSTEGHYAADWASFTAFCRSQGIPELPAMPATVAAYITWLATRPIEGVVRSDGRPRTRGPAKAATIRRHLSSISVRHQEAGHSEANPCETQQVRKTWRGIVRTIGSAPTKKSPLDVGRYRAAVDKLSAKAPSGIRDRAILGIGFTGAFRRAELAAIKREHLTFETEGVVIRIPFSKTNQEGKEERIVVKYAADATYCAVRALERWLDLVGLRAHAATGPVFREVTRHGRIGEAALAPKAIAAIVKKCAVLLGLDAEDFAGHSLRRGYLTSTYAHGASERAIMRQSRHKSVIIARGYMADATLWSDYAADGLL